MPGWRPEWADVAFDHGAAAHAAAACRSAARRTSTVRDELTHQARAVTATWEGLGRAAFTTDVDGAQQVLDALADEMLRLAARIDLASDQATLEQRRREAERERWRREKAAADARRAREAEELAEARRAHASDGVGPR